MNKKNAGSNILIMAEVMILAVVLVLSLVTGVFATGQRKEKKDTDDAFVMENPVSDTKTLETFTEGAVVFDEDIEEKITSMTTEEKVAQLFLVTPEDLTGNPEVTVAGEGCKGAINTTPVGGMILSRSNLLDKESTRDNLSNLQMYSNERIGSELLLVAEQEADGNEGVVTTDYMKENGISGVRLVSSVPEKDADPAIIEETIRASYADYQDHGIFAMVPFAADEVMAAEGSTEETLTNYRNGFAKAIKSAWGIQMNSGNCKLITGKDGESLSLSVDAVKVLRNEMSYNGVLVSAPLTEELVAAKGSVGETAVAAICCGMSMVYAPSGFDEAYQAVLQAVSEGTISDTMLHNAVGRILMAKKNMSNENAADAAAEAEEQARAEEEARAQSTQQTNRNNNTTQQPAEQPVAQEPAPEQQPIAAPEIPEAPQVPQEGAEGMGGEM